MRRDGGSVFPAHANTGDPNGPNRGLSANENARALISMMARSKCSNQSPDTLSQDPSPPPRGNHLQRTVGPYMGAIAGPPIAGHQIPLTFLNKDSEEPANDRPKAAPLAAEVA